MKKEIATLVKMHSWIMVKREEWMKVTPLQWVLKIKRTASGIISKLKARIVVRGDLETEGVDYFETYTPTAKWVPLHVAHGAGFSNCDIANKAVNQTSIYTTSLPCFKPICP